MPATLQDILAPGGAVARRLGTRYESRPQQMEMALAVGEALEEGHHLLVEAGTGVGKSFSYLLPAIDYAVRNKKRVVISTHTISLQEQLIEKDIPLLQAVYPDEFTAVLVKGRGNYLCQRRLEQTRAKQVNLFDNQRQLDSLWTIEEWSQKTRDGSLADLPNLPDPGVWDRVRAEQGNCLGKKCSFYKDCFWQAAKRRMQSGTLLIVNHALFFSDLALRAAGVNYLPKYDAVILDEAHTVEDVAGKHFGIEVSESSLRYQLRMLYDPKRGRGLLSTHGGIANDAIQDVVDLHFLADQFFDDCQQWHAEHGRGNGRIREAGIVGNGLSPKLHNLALHLKEMLLNLSSEEEISELSANAEKISLLVQSLDALLKQKLTDTVYWMAVSGQANRRMSLDAAPINVAQGLKMHLFDKIHSVVMTSATLCTARVPAPRGTGYQPVISSSDPTLKIRQGISSPLDKTRAIYSVTFRLADSLPRAVVERWVAEREEIVGRLEKTGGKQTDREATRLKKLFSEHVEKFLDAGHGECWLRRDDVGELVEKQLKHFDGQRYQLLAWSVMPNHVHAVVRPIEGYTLVGILHSWKSYTANHANKLIGRSGAFWQPEYCDHIVRDESELIDTVNYVVKNAVTAGLEGWKRQGSNVEAINALLNGATLVGEGAKNAENHGLVARATGKSDPFQYIKSRIGAA